MSYTLHMNAFSPLVESVQFYNNVFKGNKVRIHFNNGNSPCIGIYFGSIGTLFNLLQVYEGQDMTCQYDIRDVQSVDLIEILD